MVKVQDGQMLLGGQALSGEAQDDEGNPLKFELVEGTTAPHYQAKVNLNDGSGSTKFYSFGLENASVRISVITKTPDQIQTDEKSAKLRKEEESKAAKKTTAKAASPDDFEALADKDQKEDKQEDTKQNQDKDKEDEEQKTEEIHGITGLDFEETAVPSKEGETSNTGSNNNNKKESANTNNRLKVRKSRSKR